MSGPRSFAPHGCGLSQRGAVTAAPPRPSAATSRRVWYPMPSTAGATGGRSPAAARCSSCAGAAAACRGDSATTFAEQCAPGSGRTLGAAARRAHRRPRQDRTGREALLQHTDKVLVVAAEGGRLVAAQPIITRGLRTAAPDSSCGVVSHSLLPRCWPVLQLHPLQALLAGRSSLNAPHQPSSSAAARPLGGRSGREPCRFRRCQGPTRIPTGAR